MHPVLFHRHVTCTRSCSTDTSHALGCVPQTGHMHPVLFHRHVTCTGLCSTDRQVTCTGLCSIDRSHAPCPVPQTGHMHWAVFHRQASGAEWKGCVVHRIGSPAAQAGPPHRTSGSVLCWKETFTELDTLWTSPGNVGTERTKLDQNIHAPEQE
ncbi:unnamed protein product [Arctogadus glacialis]